MQINAKCYILACLNSRSSSERPPLKKEKLYCCHCVPAVHRFVLIDSMTWLTTTHISQHKMDDKSIKQTHRREHIKTNNTYQSYKQTYTDCKQHRNQLDLFFTVCHHVSFDFSFCFSTCLYFVLLLFFFCVDWQFFGCIISNTKKFNNI